jgi:hypothetical protein
MVAGIIHACGAYGGPKPLKSPNRWNRKGMFENVGIRNSIVKPFLRSIGADPMGQRPLPDMRVISEFASNQQFVEEWRNRVLSAMSLPDENPVWFYKGAKMCLMWPIWANAFPDARWLIVRRPDRDIARSCVRTSFMRKWGNFDGWLRWVAHHKLQFGAMKTCLQDVTEVHSDAIIAGEYDALEEFVRRAGLVWRKKAVDGFVDPSLFHTGTRSVTDGKQDNRERRECDS